MPSHQQRPLLTLTVMACLALVGCDSRLLPTVAQSNSAGAQTSGLMISPSSSELRVGGTAQLTVTGPSELLPANFSTASPGVAVVSTSGRVTALGLGTAVITATSTRDVTQRAVAVVHVVP
jgi:uncharacterized protein YjdB